MGFIMICMQAYKSPTHFVKKKNLFIDCHCKSHVGRHHYSNTLTVSSCNLNWFDTSVGICGAEQPQVSAAASYSMQVFERTHLLLTQCY